MSLIFTNCSIKGNKADSVYISAHLTKPQLKFLKLLDDYEVQLFKLNAKSENTVKRAWKNSLGHQIASRKLPAFDEVKKDLELLFNEIFETI